MTALIAYLAAVLDDGDYANDHLTHMPEVVRPVIEVLGFILATITGA